MFDPSFLADAPPWGTALVFTVIKNSFGSGAGQRDQ